MSDHAIAATPLTQRTITELDQVRLEKLLDAHGTPEPLGDNPALDELIDLARIVPSQAVPPQVATLNSRLQVQQLSPLGSEQEITLCWPQDADAARGAISVHSPVGTALLGLSEGDTAAWRQADGLLAQARLTRVLYQPEANGEYTR